MWRPEDWENPYEPVWGNPFRGEFHVAYEAGADAMLIALKPYLEKVSDVCDRVNSLLAAMGVGKE